MSDDIHIDFETRSSVDLKSVGAHRYAIDPSTEILMCGVSAEDSEEVFLWINPKYAIAQEMGENDEAEALIRSAKRLHCHNAPFEQAVIWGVHQRGGTSPFSSEPDLSQWRCTAAVARKAGLPWSLEKMGEALNLDTKKDREGAALIRFFSLPTKDGTFNQPRDFPEKWVKFCDYCRQDVKSEKAGAKKLKPFELKGDVLDSFHFDLRMNQRGLPVNVGAASHAQRIIENVQSNVEKVFVEKTGLNPTQREKVRLYFESRGALLPDMQAETLQVAIAATRDPEVRELLSLYQKTSYAAVKKVATMLECVCPDGRVRGTHLWHGTGPGRSSGRLVQPQNFKKTPPHLRPITPLVYARIAGGADANSLDCLYGDPLELIAASIRHFIHEPTGPILDGDYAAIQARTLCWLAGQKDALEEYRQGLDRYVLMASFIYRVPPAKVNSDQRTLGKVAVLALGFGMGTDKFFYTCNEMYGLNVSMDLCETAKIAFREKHNRVVDYWYRLEGWVRAAIGRPGEKFGPFIVRTISGIQFLLGVLPSGRAIAYPHPKIEPDPQFGTQITYWGQIPGMMAWGRVKLYGGKIAENFCMGVEADLITAGGIEAEKQGMPPFMLVHDQLLAYRTNGKTAEDFSKALTTLPAWAAGLPVKADCKITPYYSK